MLKEKKNADFVDSKRLGPAFEQDKLFAMYKSVGEAGLPVVPYHATIDELNRIIEYIACQLPYLQDSMGVLKVEQQRRDYRRQQVYSEVYRRSEKGMAGATQATLKMVAEATPEVKAADAELQEVLEKVTLLENRIKAFTFLDQDVRKLLTAEMQARDLRMD